MTAATTERGAKRRFRRTSRHEEPPSAGHLATKTWWGRALVRIVVFVVCALWILPILGLFVSSFRTNAEIRESGWWNVFLEPFGDHGLSLDAYRTMLDPNALGVPFVNTIAVTIPAVVIPILIAAYAAYAFTWMEFRFRGVLMYLFVAMLVVPLQVAFIPLLSFWTDVGLDGTFVAVWLTHAAFAMPITTLILSAFISRLPRELIEAARADSASNFQIFWNIVLPLSLPAIAGYAVFQFLWIWNDTLVALTFLDNDRKVLTVGILGLMQDFGIQWDQLAAGAFISMVVPLIIFVTLQRYLVRGLLGGSVKG